MLHGKIPFCAKARGDKRTMAGRGLSFYAEKRDSPGRTERIAKPLCGEPIEHFLDIVPFERLSEFLPRPLRFSGGGVCFMLEVSNFAAGS